MDFKPTKQQIEKATESLALLSLDKNFTKIVDANIPHKQRMDLSDSDIKTAAVIKPEVLLVAGLSSFEADLNNRAKRRFSGLNNTEKLDLISNLKTVKEAMVKSFSGKKFVSEAAFLKALSGEMAKQKIEVNTNAPTLKKSGIERFAEKIEKKNAKKTQTKIKR